MDLRRVRREFKAKKWVLLLFHILLLNFHHFQIVFHKLVFYFRISEDDYVKTIKEEINNVVKLQEELDIDVLVHGEPEVTYHPKLNNLRCCHALLHK